MSALRICGWILYFAFYATFYVKAFLQWKHGISTIRIGRGEKPRRTYWVELALVAALIVNAAVQFAGLCFEQAFARLWDSDALRWLGGVLAMSGILLLIASMIKLGDSWRGGIDYRQQTRLVMTGLYAVSRNPAFTGFDLFYLGMALMFPNLPNLILSGLLMVLLHLQILEEEKFLTVTFGSDYQTYRSHTNRYFGPRKRDR